ncbi:MAG: ATP-grasp domain-containing protein [Rhodobacteraceae bacterium]|nr:ATP-grasp domain-containing protein [Paracoccaceae bacterium]
MFRKLLIANRGEIACRIIRTAKRLGIPTVAVYSDADASALHVRQADEAVRLGPSAPAESYLSTPAILAAAGIAGADAVHPGYGFLSENPEFAEQVELAGLTFIGPPAAAIRSMGIKSSAKRLMQAASVPVIPGYHGTVQSAARLKSEAAGLGYPVLIKAAAGGGGKGMRVAGKASEFPRLLSEARREAVAAFGDGEMIIERLIRCPRHIEVQIFADRQGTVIHLFERDCSLQRRYQKVIEECPAPGISDEFRQAVCEAAIGAARAIGYVGAGTVEFIAEGADGLRPDKFWFLEMNTRLQVEHPVTEAATGLDLVELQFLVAAGHPLPATACNPRLRSYAMEARLYAEDPASGFLPSAGRLTRVRFPGGARVDSGVSAGDQVSPYYDPMIAKVVTQAASREEARLKLADALQRTRIHGVRTNRAFLTAILALPEFVQGEFSTNSIEEIFTRRHAVDPPTAAVILAAIAFQGDFSCHASLTGFTLWQPLTRQIHLCFGQTVFEAWLTILSPTRIRVSIGDEIADCAFCGRGWRIDGSEIRATAVAEEGRAQVFLDGIWEFTLPHPESLAEAAVKVSDGGVRAPMPGIVGAVLVAVGDQVREGEGVAIIEAMKMELTLPAPCDGSVTEIRVAAGSQVADGDDILIIGSPDGGGFDTE